MSGLNVRFVYLSGELPLEDLIKKYQGAYDSEFEAELSALDTDGSSSEDEDETEGDYVNMFICICILHVCMPYSMLGTE